MLLTEIIQILMETTNRPRSLIRTLSLSNNYPRKKKNKRMLRRSKENAVIHKERIKIIIIITTKIMTTTIRFLDHITLLLQITSFKVISTSFYKISGS